MSTGLCLFKKLCEVGNALEGLRDMYTPGTDQWLFHTEALAMLDEVVDLLVDSAGIDDEDH
jgi:hypothetical protein